MSSSLPRLTTLDGLRGLAIILVVLTHVNISFLRGPIHPWLLQMITGSGVTGVCILFILSGFLMATLYPRVEDPFAFIQKRYSRIFPLFLSITTILMVIRQVPLLPWYAQVLLTLGVAGLGHVIWVYGIQKVQSRMLGKILFFGFFLLQIAVGLLYVGWIGRHPAQVFFQQWPAVARETTIGLVNGTLTLPLGDYIPMLEGVYWSLAAEVLFYVVYPFVCIPLLALIQKRSRAQKILLLLLLVPFFGGLTIVFDHVFVLSMLQIYLFFYFCTGITAGYLFVHHQDWIRALRDFFNQKLGILSVVVFFLVILVKTLTFNLIPEPLSPWLHMVWAFPLTLLVLWIALPSDDSILTKVLTHKRVIFLGTISYSMYLVHTIVIHFLEKVTPVYNVQTSLWAIFWIFAFTIGLSTSTYYLLERPYFLRKKNKDKTALRGRSLYSRLFTPASVLVGCSLLFAMLIFIAFQSQFNFFSQIHSLPIKDAPGTVSLADTGKADFSFTSADDTLQILAIHLKRETKPNMEQKKQILHFRIKEKTSSDWYAQSDYNLPEIGDSPRHLLAFPLLTNTRGKTYDIQFELSDPTTADYLVLYPDSLIGVYGVDKKAIIENPMQFIEFVGNKIGTIASQSDAKMSLILGTPAFLLLGIMLISQTLSSKKLSA